MFTSTPRKLSRLSTSQRRKLSARTQRFETLENRYAMAADIFFEAGGVLAVVGTNNRDVITAYQVGATPTWNGMLVVNITNEAGQTLNQLAVPSDAVSRLRIAAGRGNDLVQNFSNKPGSIDGGEGDDRLVGGVAGEQITGGDGRDFITGGHGSDTIDGGYGHDVIHGEGGADLINGRSGNDLIYGNEGADRIFGDEGNDQILAGADMDYVFGGAGNDILWSGDGDDQLFGDAGDDQLFGEGGWDNLRGGDGNDFLDAGSLWEPALGESGLDFNAYLTAIEGTQMTDVVQGGGPSCWVLAGLASAANTGANLDGRIEYLGAATYRVHWLRPDGTGAMYQDVFFNGQRYGADAQTAENTKNLQTFYSSAFAESWVIIYQRAILQQAGREIDNPGSGGTYHEPPLYLNRDPIETVPSDFAQVLQALAENKAVMAFIPDDSAAAAMAGLPDWHWYSVVSFNGLHVTLYNPHGWYVQITPLQFMQCFTAVTIV